MPKQTSVKKLKFDVMHKHELTISSVLALVLVILGAIISCEKARPLMECTDSIGCLHVAPDEAVRIGVLQALSGKVAPLGREQIRGIELALDKWQATILGHAIAMRKENTGCLAEGGANAALKIIADPQTVAILGTTCSGAAATASKAMSDAGLTMISGNNSAPYLTAISGRRAPSWQPGYFRTVPNEETAGQAAAIFAYENLGVRKVATINDGDIYTRGLTDGFGDAFSRLGGQIVLATSINKGDQEMMPILTAVMNSKAQLLFFPLFQPEGNHLLLQARQIEGFENIIMMSDGALIESSFIDAVQEAGKGMYFVGPSKPIGPAVESLVEKYVSKFSFSPATSYFLNAYDAADLLLHAIVRVARQDPDGSLHIGRQALRDVLYATKNYPGVTGSLTCDDFGDCSSPAFNVLRLDEPSTGLAGLQANVLFTYAPENSIDHGSLHE